MVEQDRQGFHKQLAALATIFDKEVSPLLLDTYFAALEDLPFDAVIAAIGRAAQANRFFPRPVELREAVEGSAEDRASVAWATFLVAAGNGGYASVQFVDPSTAVAMDATFESWPGACRLLHAADEPMVAHYRKAFIAAYQAARKAGRTAELYRAGQSELSLRGGEWKDRMPVLVQPVLLIGLRAVKEVRLPFDTATGTLRADARDALAGGAETVLQFAQRFAPRALAGEPPRRLGAGSEQPATREEVAEILAPLRQDEKTAPYLNLIGAA